MDMVLLYTPESVSSVSYAHEPTVQHIWAARGVQDGHRGRAVARYRSSRTAQILSERLVCVALATVSRLPLAKLAH